MISIKAKMTQLLNRKFPELSAYPRLWRRGAFCISVGQLNEAIVRAYIQNQKDDD